MSIDYQKINMSIKYYEFGEDDMPIFADENPRYREDRQILPIYDPQVRGHFDYRKIEFRTSIGDYELRDKVGAGKQGIIRKALHRSGAIVAVKRMDLVSRENALESNELKFLLQLRNVESVIRMLSVIQTDQPYAVFEYAHMDLKSVATDKDYIINASHVKIVAYQLLKGLEAIHKMNIVHRDIKPTHILLSESGMLKITGFDKAAFILVDGQPAHSDQTGDLSYLAPESLFGHTQNSDKLDIWSAGCVIAELAYREVLFAEDTVTSQITWIARVLGPFTGSYYTKTAMYADQSKFFEGERTNCSNIILRDNTVSKSFPLVDARGVSVLRSLLQLLPTARVSAEQALQTKWVRGGQDKDLRDVVKGYKGYMFYLHEIMRRENENYEHVPSRGPPRFRNLLGSTPADFKYEEIQIQQFGETDPVF